MRINYTITPKLFDLGGQNCARIIALGNSSPMITNYLVFEQNLTKSS